MSMDKIHAFHYAECQDYCDDVCICDDIELWYEIEAEVENAIMNGPSDEEMESLTSG